MPLLPQYRTQWAHAHWRRTLRVGAWEAWKRRVLPYVAVGLVNVGVLLVARFLFLNPQKFAANFAPDDASDVIGTVLQVQATFTALAFAGLALVVQMADSPAMASFNVRAVLMEHTGFRFSIVASLSITVALAVIYSWMASDGAVVLVVCVLLIGTVALIGWSFTRATNAAASKAALEKLTRRALLQQVRRSVREMKAIGLANRDLSVMAEAGKSGLSMFVASEPKLRTFGHTLLSGTGSTLKDVNLCCLRLLRACAKRSGNGEIVLCQSIGMQASPIDPVLQLFSDQAVAPWRLVYMRWVARNAVRWGRT